MKTILPSSPILAGVMSLLLLIPTNAQPLFSESFEADTSAEWTLRSAALNGEADVQAEFGFDYSLESIPSAPSGSDESTKGLKLTVNKSAAIDGKVAINLFPNGQSFSNDFYVSFDLWVNAKGSNTATEYVIFGINHTGASVNWEGSADSGAWFAIAADGGASASVGDYRAFEGATLLAGASAGFNIDTNVTASTSVESRIGAIFPNPKWTFTGAPANNWVRVRVVQFQGKLSLYFNDNLVLQRDRSSLEASLSGNLMLGYMDTNEEDSPDQPDDLFVIYDNIRVGRIVTVTTASNLSVGGDGQTSFLEAMTDLRAGDEIRFNISATATNTHYIETPAEGYPEITVDDVFINGYSQVGASANTSTILGTNNARIKIVLDSRTGGRHVLDHPGFGTGESGIISVVNAQHVRVEGMAFLGVKGSGEEGDASIYAVALVGNSDHVRVSGCWFGLDPVDRTTVATVNAGIAGFRYNPSGEPVEYPDATIVGNIGEGPDGVHQFNIFIGMTIPVILEGSGYRISGNFFNVYPNGVEDYNHGLVEAEFEGHIEIGRDGSNLIIGTNGDGQSDEDERNVFGGVIAVAYDTMIEFYGGGSPQTNIIIAGNYVGVGIDAETQFTNSSYFVSRFQATATARIGSNFDGISDEVEANLVFNNYPVEFHFPNPEQSVPRDLINVSVGAEISVRGNWLKGNLVPPVSPTASIYLDYYGAFIRDTNTVRPVLFTSSTTARLEGVAPIGKVELGLTNTIIDVYLPDQTSLLDGLLFLFPEFTNGFVQSHVYLGSFEVDSEADLDLDPGEFAFDISSLNLNVGTEVTATATISQDEIDSVSARGHTTAAAEVVTLGLGPDLLQITSSITANGQITIEWQGGLPPFQLQRCTDLTEGDWEDVGLPILLRTSIQVMAEGNVFYRVKSN